MARERRGESLLMRLYAKNLVMATIASDVIGADVEDERMTCRNGCSKEGISKSLISACLSAAFSQKRLGQCQN